MKSKEWREEHDKHDGICANCSPEKRGCCSECFHKNIAHETSLDFCSDIKCECHFNRAIE